MKAMLFAAGLGTRLRPYTNDRPKALVEVAGKSLLEINLRRLRAQGASEVVVNVHHHAAQVVRFLQSKDDWGLHVHISDESDLLLDTGGGLLRARPWLDGAPFLVHNVDILSDLDLAELYQAHLHSGRIATLALRARGSSRYLRFDEQGRLVGWRHARTGAEKWCLGPVPDAQDLAFSGISVLSPAIFDYFPEGRPVFSLIDVLLRAGASATVGAYRHDGGAWLDVGRPEALAPAADLVSRWAG